LCEKADDGNFYSSLNINYGAPNYRNKNWSYNDVCDVIGVRTIAIKNTIKMVGYDAVNKTIDLEFNNNGLDINSNPNPPG